MRAQRCSMPAAAAAEDAHIGATHGAVRDVGPTAAVAAAAAAGAAAAAAMWEDDDDSAILGNTAR